MNYLKHYVKLIRNAEKRGWTKNVSVYTEEHHTFMTAIFGKNSRVVVVTGREHFLCHLLLWKGLKQRYGEGDWRTIKAGIAISSMGMKCRNKKERHTPTSRQFHQSKVAFSESTSGDNHWSRQPGATSPFLALNTDPERAKWLGELNREHQLQKSKEGKHPWQNPDTKHVFTSETAAAAGAKGKGMKWWTNGKSTTKSFTRPGPEWYLGRKPRQNSPTPEEKE